MQPPNNHGPATAPPVATVLVDARAQLGECVLWCEREQALYWTDIDSARLSRRASADGALRTWALPEPVGSFALCQQPGTLLLGLASGVALFDLDSGRLGALSPVETDQPATRINDGRCDPQGRFVFGMFNQTGDQPLGHFYRVGPDLVVQRLPLPAATVANALCFSPDGRRLYFSDSPTRQIWWVDYHADGRLGVPQLFATLADDDGFPDGATVDAEGGLWTALWGGGCVLRLDAQGREDRRWPVPARHPTCPAFGGAGLDQLFVSSARKALDADGLRREPAAGAVFLLQAGLRGRPEHRFATTLAP